MCGIAGFCIHKDEKVNAKKLSLALLAEIEARGEDATGAAWVQTNKETKKASIVVSKAPVAARDFDQYLADMPTGVKRAVLHTRWATQGSPGNNLNNHPIVSGRVVGVHNGHLSNDRQVFDYFRADRRGEVDSEAAFALLDRTVYRPTEVLQSLKGRAALAWLDARDKRDLHLARVDGSPLAVGATHAGSLVFASTMPLLVSAMERVNISLSWVEDIEPMTYMRVRNGEIVELENIGTSVKAIA